MKDLFRVLLRDYVKITNMKLKMNIKLSSTNLLKI